MSAVLHWNMTRFMFCLLQCSLIWSQLVYFYFKLNIALVHVKYNSCTPRKPSIWIASQATISHQWQKSRRDGFQAAFQCIILLQQSRDNVTWSLTGIASTDAVTCRCLIQLSEAWLAFHHVLSSQTVNPLIQAMCVIRTEPVTQHNTTYQLLTNEIYTYTPI